MNLLHLIVIFALNILSNEAKKPRGALLEVKFKGKIVTGI